MFNSVTLIGNLTRDPETRVVGQNSTPVSKFGLATNRKAGDKTETTFVDVECWGKTAENVGAYLKKGRQVLVSGRLKQDSWEDKDGNKRTKLFVVAENVQFIGGKKDAEEASADAAYVPDDDVPF